jgi:glycolate oxidase iron-sulfur subunit
VTARADSGGLPPDPETAARVRELLRTCVECGLCLPHCATYLATGSEVQSPRGRLLLLGEMLERPELADDDQVLAAFDLCLGCRACETVCPSGISFDLLEIAHDHAVSRGAVARPPGSGWLDRRSVLRLLRHAGALARKLVRTVLGERWRQRLDGRPLGVGRLARLLGTLPAAPPGDTELEDWLEAIVTVRRSARAHPRTDAAGPTGGDGTAGRVVFFRGCASDALLPGTARRLRALLAAGGRDVAVPDGQVCCGALASHSGAAGRAEELRERNRAVLGAALRDDDVLVVEAAGCGLELRGYGEGIGARVRDATALLAGLDLPLGPVPIRVALHDACHARHGQGLVREPRRLLARIPGLEVVTPAEAEACCGSAGTYSLRHPEISAAMGRRKAERLAETRPDLVVTTNPGCLGQIADGLALVAPEVPIVPLSDLVWFAWRRRHAADQSLYRHKAIL